MADWREMDDEAKDAGCILLYMPDAIEPKQTIGFWTEWVDGSANWTDAATEQEIYAEITHWQPLPEAP
jgi:hypothetical protein